MKILLSNDDGVYALGLRSLLEVLREVGDVTVVAPDRNRSGASNSLTLDSPIRLMEIEPNIISVQGTPTDCVHMALTGLLDFEPDIVISGINDGPNMGDDVLYSGTVAAAMEGRYLGLPAIAFSMLTHNPQHYLTAAEIARDMVLKLKASRLPASTILNINVPDVPYDALNGIEVTRLGQRHRAEKTIKQIDPRGNTVYWIGPAGQEDDAGEGTDFWAVNRGYVSVTPLQIDLTHYKSFDTIANWFSRDVLFER